MPRCNGWIERPHECKRITQVEKGVYLCDECLTDYRAATPLESVPSADDLPAEAYALVGNLYGQLHEIQDGHDTETARGCTHYNCEAAHSVLLGLKREIRRLTLDK